MPWSKSWRRIKREYHRLDQAWAVIPMTDLEILLAYNAEVEEREQEECKA